MSILDICVGDQVFFNAKGGDDSPGAYGGDQKDWDADAGDALDCRANTPASSELGKYDAIGVRLFIQFFFAASEHDLTAIEASPRDHRLHWTSRRNGTAEDRHLRVIGCTLQDSPDDDPDMEMWVVDATEETTRGDDD